MGKAIKKRRSYSNDDSPATYIINDEDYLSLFYGSALVDFDNPKWDANSIEEIIFGNEFDEHRKKFTEAYSDVYQFELYADEEKGPEYRMEEDENY